MDVNDLVGIPWVSGGYSHKGADCWGIALLACKLFDIPMELFRGYKVEEVNLSKIIIGEADSKRWLPVVTPESKTICTMFSSEGSPDHIGFCIDGRNILHSLKGGGHGSSIITSVEVLEKIFHTLKFYRYVGDNNNIT